MHRHLANKAHTKCLDNKAQNSRGTRHWAT